MKCAHILFLFCVCVSNQTTVLRSLTLPSSWRRRALCDRTSSSRCDITRSLANCYEMTFSRHISRSVVHVARSHYFLFARSVILPQGCQLYTRTIKTPLSLFTSDKYSFVFSHYFHSRKSLSILCRNSQSVKPKPEFSCLLSTPRINFDFA